MIAKTQPYNLNHNNRTKSILIVFLWPNIFRPQISTPMLSYGSDPNVILWERPQCYPMENFDPNVIL